MISKPSLALLPGPIAKLMRPFSSDGEGNFRDVPVAVWHDIELQELSELSLPLLPDQDIVASIRCGRNTELFDPNIFLDDYDFPCANILFGPESLVHSAGNVQVFRVEYVGGVPDISLDAAREFAPAPNAAFADLARICEQSTLKGTLENVLGTVRNVCRYRDFLLEEPGGETRNLLCRNDRLESLMDRYLHEGFIEGDCKTFAMFTAGLLSALGLHARRVGGGLVGFGAHQKDSEGPDRYDGHIWPELRVRGKWISFDPLSESPVGKYPLDTAGVYFADVFLPIPEKPCSAQIRIDYVQSTGAAIPDRT